MAARHLLLLVTCAQAAVVPEELPSLLSVAYSNIPPIKKGTDSRVGFGFSLGNHADFQVVFELGPQSNTSPIGSSYASTSKRQAAAAQPRPSRQELTQSGDYLRGWSQQASRPGAPRAPGAEPHNLHQALAAVGAGPLPGTTDLRGALASMPSGGELRRAPALAPSALAQLQRLYGPQAVPASAPPASPAADGAAQRLRAELADVTLDDE